MNYINGINFEAEKAYKSRYKTLKAEQASLDYKVAKLASEIRAHFPKYTDGDNAFLAWVQDKFSGVTLTVAHDLLERAELFRKATLDQSPVKAEETWETIGGIEEARKVATLPDNIQARVFTHAKQNKVTVTEACKELKTKPVVTYKCVDHKGNAKTLVNYIKSLKLSLPKSIQEIVSEY